MWRSGIISDNGHVLRLAAAVWWRSPGRLWWRRNAASAHAPYPDPSLPVATRVSQLLATMTLDEKLGQMTQAERGSVTNADITNFALGSVLSGGGSAPSPNTATSLGEHVRRRSRTPR